MNGVFTMLVRKIRSDLLHTTYKCASVGCRQIANRLDALDHHETLDGCMSALPSKAKVVVCGGGVMGAAVAYHLAKRGWGQKTVLIEKEK